MSVGVVHRIDNWVKVDRVLVSVWDKSGLDAFVSGLLWFNPSVRFYSTAGTYEAILRCLGPQLAKPHLSRVSDYTGQPETQGGLVKTLDFKIYLGLLTEKYNDAHQSDLSRTQAVPIDMVVVNLYPFETVTSLRGVSVEAARANIDIGGPCMIRAAAKNYLRVASVVDTADYDVLLELLRAYDGRLSLTHRFQLARKAFAHTSKYERAISDFLAQQDIDAVPSIYTLVDDSER